MDRSTAAAAFQRNEAVARALMNVPQEADPPATLTAYDPSWRDDTAAWLINDLGANKTLVGNTLGSRGAGTSGTGLVDFTPIGGAFALNEGQRAFSEGDWLGGALNLAGMLPIPAAKLAKKPITNAVEAVTEALAPKIRAYHGSPHDFDKFEWSPRTSMTGEGAQAYGHGLYFAENEGVANSYKKSLGGGRNEITDPATGTRKALDYDQWHDTLPDILNQIDPKVGVFGTRWIKDAMVDAAQSGGSPLEAFDRTAAAHLQRMKTQRQPENIIRYEEASVARARAAMEQLDPKPINVGSMYEVDIDASPDEFLDWDKPLSEQPAKVRGVIGELVDRDIDQESGWKKLTGAEALDAVVIRSGKRGVAEEKLRAAGIKGIRYKDAGSRDPQKMKELADDLAQYREAAKQWAATGNEEKLKIANKQIEVLERRLQATSNYVVFSDDIINILKKYGIAGLTAGGAGAALLGGGTDQATAAEPFVGLVPQYRTGGGF